MVTYRYPTVLGESAGEFDAAAIREQLEQMASASRAAISSGEHFASFVTSDLSKPLVTQLLCAETLECDPREARDLFWEGYEIPADVSGWLIALAAVGEVLPACIVISDMRLTGNPMIYVNPEFVRVTGYSKAEAHGHNCRFLQGPRTEPQAVAEIQSTLRQGTDCHVRITNYRKSGEIFSNLLTLRPVCDASGISRFCVGVQFEVTRSRSGTDAKLHRLARLISLLPHTLPLPGGDNTLRGSDSAAALGRGVGQLGEIAEIAEHESADRIFGRMQLGMQGKLG